MIRVIDLVLLLVLGTLCAGQQYCNATHFDFRSNYSLGQQNELNCTFTKAGQKIDALENVTFKANDSVTYNIFNAKPVLYYIDSKQKAEVIDNDTIVISGGHLEVMITFNWTKKSSAPVNGSGIARALSD